MGKQIDQDRTNRDCPRFGGQCKEHWLNCALAIEKDREYPDGTLVKIKACADWLNADEHENSNNRLAMLQAEIGELKNGFVYHTLALFGYPQGKHELERWARRLLPQDKEQS